MSEMQLSFFDEPAAREYQRQQRQTELDALLVKAIGAKNAKRWHDEKNKRQAKMQEFMKGHTLRPDLQAMADEMCARVLASAKPLVNEYTLLGIAPGATKRDIKNAYRRQARKLHPDAGGDESAFKRMYAAYRHLLTIVKE